ncbi:SUMF1/EgtB/PvdO family nonheme iron enzyme [Duganella sp. BJB476]|uniref:SUMF1/EgtB/PvdO family nonheme iron enzyme n=1 Tax=Duganella sp. BJB476 TaxID=1871176 RepID=UPI000E357A58|nr:SUMF1/EgtB/PvdO family nonheme iron enzyme [Duganella sp. BJB476]RFP32456.1 hypothetical protein D0T21_09660 [Duganella sp. BJB476]
MNTATSAETTALASAVAALFATVPAVTFPDGSVEPSFQVATYLTSKGEDGTPTISASAAPWVEINYHDAVAAAAGAGLTLITERQYLALAIDIASVAANWTGGAVGEGDLKQGLRNGDFDEAQAGDVIPESTDEDRWFTLSNGERICDAAGNAYSWVFDNVQGDAQGLIAGEFQADSLSITTAPFPSLERGMGWRPRGGAAWSGFALVRGGYWFDGDVAGVFRLRCTRPRDSDDFVGFRCTKPV